MKRRFFIDCPVQAVRFRLRVQHVINCVAWGFFAAAFFAFILPILSCIILCVSVAAGFIRSFSSSQAATLIDQRYHLKDRIFTATALWRHSRHTPIEQLQIADARSHLADTVPRAVVPFRLPNVLWFALLVFVVNVSAAIGQRHFARTPDVGETAVYIMPTEHIEQLAEIVANTENLVRKHSDDLVLPELSEQLETLRDRAAQHPLDAVGTLAALSEMDEAFQSARDSLRLEAMEQSLWELAEALALSDATLPTSRALHLGNFSQAASDLRQIDGKTLDSLSQPERKTLSEQMQMLAGHADDRNQQPLSDAAQNMADALESGDGELAQSAADALASEVQQFGIRLEIAKDIALQQMMLAMMKADSSNQGNMSGGRGTEKSETDSETWGLGSAGYPDTGADTGEETQLEPHRQREMLTGMLGEEGASETERVDAHDAMPLRARLAAERRNEQFREYQRIAEAVLESEPIPLGQRQFIRRYFEAIRPE